MDSGTKYFHIDPCDIFVPTMGWRTDVTKRLSFTVFTIHFNYEIN